MESNVSAPILLIAFNRPDVSKQTFEYIRAAKPQKLYVAVDGAREGKEGEEILVKQVKEILQNVDWPCETHYKFNETNKGAERTVSSAISWVFESEEYAIILEDDIIAPLSFLKFAQEMLIKYKDDERIGTVTGSNFTPIPVPNNTDYFFAKYGHSWGWATWKRVWNSFDLNVEVPDEHLTLNFLNTITNSTAEAKFLQRSFQSMKNKGPGNSTWDHVGNYFHRISNRLSIIPRVNLTSNIGTFGLHANGESEHHFRPFDESFEVIKHPKKEECFTHYDIHHFKTYINKKTSLYKRVLKKLKNLL
ncbi:glycosyl transferase [Bacteroidota bacterium]